MKNLLNLIKTEDKNQKIVFDFWTFQSTAKIFGFVVADISGGGPPEVI